MTDANEAVSWGIFSLVWLGMVTYKAYHAGRRRGAEEERARLGRPAPPPPAPASGLTVTGTIELRDGMTVAEAAEALGKTPAQFVDSIRR